MFLSSFFSLEFVCQDALRCLQGRSMVKKEAGVCRPAPAAVSSVRRLHHHGHHHHHHGHHSPHRSHHHQQQQAHPAPKSSAAVASNSSSMTTEDLIQPAQVVKDRWKVVRFSTSQQANKKLHVNKEKSQEKKSHLLSFLVEGCIKY